MSQAFITQVMPTYMPHKQNVPIAKHIGIKNLAVGSYKKAFLSHEPSFQIEIAIPKKIIAESVKWINTYIRPHFRREQH